MRVRITTHDEFITRCCNHIYKDFGDDFIKSGFVRDNQDYKIYKFNIPDYYEEEEAFIKYLKSKRMGYYWQELDEFSFDSVFFRIYKELNKMLINKVIQQNQENWHAYSEDFTTEDGISTVLILENKDVEFDEMNSDVQKYPNKQDRLKKVLYDWFPDLDNISIL